MYFLIAELETELSNFKQSKIYFNNFLQNGLSYLDFVENLRVIFIFYLLFF